MSATKFNASITAAGRVTRNSGDSIAAAQVGEWLKISGGLYEIMTTSSADLTLDEWAGGAVTADAKVLPTVGNVNAATTQLREVSIFATGLLGQQEQYTTGTGNVTFTTAAGVNITHPTIKQQILDKNLAFNAFGLGLPANAIAPLPVTSIDTLHIPPGDYRVITANTGDRPAGFSTFGILSVKRYDATIDSQTYEDVSGNRATRLVRTAGVDDWKIDFNSGNTNFNEFTGNSRQDFVLKGSARTSTQARFYKDLNSFTDPVSITVTSTFRLELADLTIIATGLGIADIAMQVDSTGTMLVIDIEFLTGMTAKEPIFLRAETNTSKIQANY